MEKTNKNSSIITENSSETLNSVIINEKNEKIQPKTTSSIVPSTSESSTKPEVKALHSEDDGEKDYESEPLVSKLGGKKRFKRRPFLGFQGKTVHPKAIGMSKEIRDLVNLEKNLKIEGMIEPPKIRKRRFSVSANVGRSHDKDTPFKRKRLASLDSRPKKDHMPKWNLLGGDATDPLNLNGLANSEEGRLLNLKTPESSPLPTPDFRKIVYVKVPPNIEDPLNLEGKHDQRVLDMMLNATIKKRHRSKRKSQSHDQKDKDINQNKDEKLENLNLAENKIQVESKESQYSVDSGTVSKIPEEKIKSPEKKSVGTRSRSISTSPERKLLKRQLSGGRGRFFAKSPTKFPDKPKFTLGNYNRYYGYRNLNREIDPRLRHFDITWFKGKDVLDIGCNVGHITLAVAEQFHPHKILGLDIDGKLVHAARQNIRHMLSVRRKDSSKYPAVFEVTRGPLEAHPMMGSSDQFPNNVLFSQGNYVPGSEEILNLQREEYDTILALSITKWIHLNNGDHGLKLFFNKIFRQLRPGGRLLLEPQPFVSYRKKAKLSPELFRNFSQIKLKPEGFRNYLLSIGFVKCEVIGVPVTKSKGFRRPLILFTKSDNAGLLQQKTPEGFLYSDFCTQCKTDEMDFCDHVQFTGMRSGAYADRMYDHISYKPSSTRNPNPYVYSSSSVYSDPPEPNNNLEGEPSQNMPVVVNPASGPSDSNSNSGSSSRSSAGNDSVGSSSSSSGGSSSSSSGSSSSHMSNSPVVNGLGQNDSPNSMQFEVLENLNGEQGFLQNGNHSLLDSSLDSDILAVDGDPDSVNGHHQNEEQEH